MFGHFDQLCLKTKAKSMALGRRLYTFKSEGKNYWLKLQLQDSHPTSKAGFEHELSFYQKQGSYDFVLPVQFLEIDDFFKKNYISGEWYYRMLILILRIIRSLQ